MLNTRPTQVWCPDIIYISVRREFLSLVAAMDRATRKVLVWRLSNTLDARFSLEVLNEVITKYGKPDIMNSDQGSQFTDSTWFTTLTETDVKISMGGRFLKQEAIYLHELHDCVQAKRLVDSSIGFNTSEGPHPVLEK